MAQTGDMTNIPPLLAATIFLATSSPCGLNPLAAFLGSFAVPTLQASLTKLGGRKARFRSP
eukprot:scaffold1867_cov247-Pinguiococcus_pyrenoidosus.AAC.15